jgi:pteridine reductase
MNALGKIALVTGGARRVGRAIALELAGAGCDVAIHFRSSAADAQETVRMIAGRGRRAAAIHGDLDQPADWPRIVAATVDELGGLDILINNASTFDPTPINNFDSTKWEQTLRINCIAPAGLSAAARTHLTKSGAGSIINLCDISAERPWRNYAAYCASKAALICLTKALAKEFAPAIRVNGISPGIAEFPDSYDQATRQKLISRVPLGRAGTPEDIAKAVRFLVFDADYVSGQILTVDGGRSIR